MLLAVAGTSFAAQIFVDATAGGANDGSSWANAFTSLQSALAVAGNNQINVAAGTYTPSSTGDQSASFVPNANTAIMGGYPSGGGVRNPSANVTILSGDLTGNDTLYDLALDFPAHKFDLKDNAGGTRAENSYTVMIVSGKANVVLDGLTIQCGNKTNGSGGGIIGDAGTKLAINNCKIDNNYCNNHGGGIYFSAGTNEQLTITNSTITNNTCKNNWGGGMRLDGGVYFTLTNTVVKGNVSWDDGAGGVFVGASVTNIANCLFQKNWSWDGAGMVARSSAGGPTAMGTPFICNISNTIFDTNQGQWSCPGAMLEMDSDNWTAGGGSAPTYTADRMIINVANCLFNGNSSVGKQNGALGIVCTNQDPAQDVQTANITNCTFANNTSGLSGLNVRMMGICYGSYFRGTNGGGSTANIKNCIIWNPNPDAAPEIEVGPKPNVNLGNGVTWLYGFIKTTTSYCDIDRQPLADPNSGYGTEIGNITGDPQFVVADTLYNVQETSPSIDAGDPASDFSNEAACNGGRINIGWTGGTGRATRALPADTNCDNTVDLADFSKLASEWLQ